MKLVPIRSTNSGVRLFTRRRGPATPPPARSPPGGLDLPPRPRRGTPRLPGGLAQAAWESQVRRAPAWDSPNLGRTLDEPCTNPGRTLHEPCTNPARTLDARVPRSKVRGLPAGGTREEPWTNPGRPGPGPGRALGRALGPAARRVIAAAAGRREGETRAESREPRGERRETRGESAVARTRLGEPEHGSRALPFLPGFSTRDARRECCRLQLVARLSSVPNKRRETRVL